jgi:serine/threonine-protein kinase RsbW
MPSFSRHFLGTARSVAEARRFVTALLGDSSMTESAELIVSELAANAINHTASGRFGGRFVVTVRLDAEQAWLAVVDEGGRSTPRCFHPSPDGEGGRGLYVVSELSADWGVRGDEHGRTVWASLTAGREASWS